MDFYEGEILLINKPKEWTSFDVVNKVRNVIRRKFEKKLKVGHAGTLDPLASGLLIICTGKKTKQISEFSGLDKEYIAKIVFGATRPSFDKETEIDKHFDNQHITVNKLEKGLNSFMGVQEQTPPVFSAKKINGQKAYINARKGKEVQMRTVNVEFKKIDLLEHNLPENATIKLLVSKGTYIRSFADDLGKRLNSGAYLDELIRTKIGSFSLEDAITPEQFEDMVNQL
jgi:tRNA pseudouridine55 synthase